ncbi:MAG: hypothetical protein IJC07_05860 [Clostridia bacterium]|nr:hypothetical protein [Clostridia bacterium]
MIEFKSLAGNFYPKTSMREGEEILVVHNCVVDEFFDYLKTLKDNGYNEACYRQIGADSQYPYNKNYYACYTDGHSGAHVFFDASRHTIRIIHLDNYTPVLEGEKGAKVCPPSLTQVSIFSGMCYCVQLSNGNFLLFDGGVYVKEDAKRLFDFLKVNTKKEQKPVIENWFFTHPDYDHIQLATKFFKEYGEKLSVKAVSYNFPDCDKINQMVMTEKVKGEIAEFEKNIEINLKGVQIYTLYTGQTYNYAAAEVEVIWSAEANYPKTFTSYNDISAAFCLTFDGGKKAVLLGDCGHDECRRISDLYGDYLKSEVLQLAHHGLIGGDKRLYQQIDPDICFWPTTEIRFLGKLPNQKYQWCIGEGGCDYNTFIRDESIKKRVHHTHENTVTLKFDKDQIITETIEI